MPFAPMPMRRPSVGPFYGGPMPKPEMSMPPMQDMRPMPQPEMMGSQNMGAMERRPVMRPSLGGMRPPNRFRTGMY